MYKHFFILFLFINDIGTIIPSGIRMIKHKLESQLLRFEINFPNRRHKGSILQLIYCNIRRLQIMSRISCAVSLFQINSYLISLFNQFFLELPRAEYIFKRNNRTNIRYTHRQKINGSRSIRNIFQFYSPYQNSSFSIVSFLNTQARYSVSPIGSSTIFNTGSSSVDWSLSVIIVFPSKSLVKGSAKGGR